MPAEGRRRHAAGPPAHTRAGECQALVGSGGRRGHQTSPTCAGRSRRATARKSSPAAPPVPGGELPERRTPPAARPPAFPPDLDLRHHPRVSCRHPTSRTPGGAETLGSSDSSSVAWRYLTTTVRYSEGGVGHQQLPARNFVPPRRPGRVLLGWGGQGVAGGAGSPTVQLLPTKPGWAKGL